MFFRWLEVLTLFKAKSLKTVIKVFFGIIQSRIALAAIHDVLSLTVSSFE